MASMKEDKTQLRAHPATTVPERLSRSPAPIESGLTTDTPASEDQGREPSFLWVNKTDARILSAVKGYPSARDIRSHAQKSSRRRTELMGKARTDKDPARTTAAKRQFHDDGNTSRAVTRASRIRETSHVLNRSLQSIDTAPLSIDRSAAYLLTFHVQWWCSVTSDLKAWYYRGMALSPDSNVLQSCFRCPCYMLSVLHFTAVQMKRLGVGSPEALQEDTERLYVKTIRELQSVICQDEHQQIYMLEVVIYVLQAEIHRQRIQAARMHLGAVVTLLDRVGGHSRLSSYLEDILINSDFYVSLPSLDRPKLGSHIQSNKSCAALSISDEFVHDSERLREASWTGMLRVDVIRWAVDMFLLNIEILTRAWTDQELAFSGSSVRHRCLHIVLRLLEEQSDAEALSDHFELDRITMILYTVMAIAAVVEPQGARGYIPLFSQAAISRYEETGLDSIAGALKQWNSILGNNDDIDLLSSLLDVPWRLEQEGNIKLGRAASRFVAMERKKRNARIDACGPASDEDRGYPLGIWQTPFLQC
jgi:hypothetical protein